MEKKERWEGTRDANATAPKSETDLRHTEPSDLEEDDLDELDDLLDEFSATKIDRVQDGKQSIRTEQRGLGQLAPGDTDVATADFSKQLQEQMAALLSETDESPEMKREIEAMMQELGATVNPGPSSTSTGRPDNKTTVPNASIGTEESFQETIRKTIERMQASGEEATAAATSEDPDDVLAQMLKQMQGGNVGGPGNEEDFSQLLMGMMEQLTTKEILYEPMKELHDRFPAWMSKNRESTKQDDVRRYERQQRMVGEIIEKFEEKGYSDSHPADREYIVGRMQEMQAAGSPPADLAGDMHAAQEALGEIDPGCIQQ